MKDNQAIEQQIDEKISLALNLAETIQRDFGRVDGGIKIKRLIEKEMKFLKRLRSNYEEEKVFRQLQCTNLNFYDHLVKSLYIYRENNISAMAMVQRRNCDDKNIRVDIVCDDKQEILWIKIIARNSTSLIDGLLGEL
jgi:hypothetical protein